MTSSDGWLMTNSSLIGQIMNTLSIVHGAAGSQDEVKRVLAHLAATAHRPSKTIIEVNLILGAFCLLSSDAEIQRKLLEPVLKFAEKDGPTALRLFPVLLATLNYQADAVKLVVLSSLPKLSVHKVSNVILAIMQLTPGLSVLVFILWQACIKPVLNVLAALKTKDTLRVVALRGMVDVWRVEERCPLLSVRDCIKDTLFT